MSFREERSDWRRAGVPGLVLLAVVALMRPLEARLAPERAGRPALGSGLAVIGGFRAVVAGGCWLRANLAWERRDAVATRALLELTVRADGRPLYFWLNGARMLAHDVPEWGLDTGAPAAVRERVKREHAEIALAWLDEAEREHGRSAALLIEKANIRLRALGDREGAARLFRMAAEQPGAPWHAARIHGELLRTLGRPAAALAWLRQILPGLPADDPAAQREVVEQRIRELERELGGG